MGRTRSTPDTSDAAWPVATLGTDGFRVGGRLCAALELAPLNLELMADAEREAAVAALSSFYDAVPRPFGLLSVPADRPPHEHLSQVEERLDGKRAREWFRSYAALYREVAGGIRRPVRRTYLHIDAVSTAELDRAFTVVRRVATDSGIVFREVDPAELAELWSEVARPGTAFRLGPSLAAGPALVAAVALGRRWPGEIAPGWLAPLLASDGLAAASVRVHPLSRAEAMHFLTLRLRHVRAAERLAMERGELDDVARERLGETASAARRTVHAGAGRLYLVDTVFLVEAPDRESLVERLEALRLEARGLELDVEPATFRLAEAWAACLPGPAPAPIAERNLDSAALAASLLHAASDLYEPSGHLYGRARSSAAPIVLDRFAHPSHNAIVLGQTGTGKTMFTGAEIGRCYLRGIRVLVVDPLGDYRRLSQALGGIYVDLGAGGAINPFVLAGERTPAALAAKLQALARLVTAMAGGLSRDERAALDLALRQTYETAGSGADPATHDRPAPRLADLVEHLGAVAGGASLAHRLERWATGSLAGLFAADEPLPLDARLLIVGLAAISDPEVRSVAQLAALSLLWDAVRRDLAPKLVVVDEAWKVMRQPAGAEFVEELARSARHYHAGLQLATQDIVEFLRSDFGEPIVKQCDVRVLLGQTPEGADALTRYFDLTAAERRLLLHARPGDGLLFVGRSHIAFEAIVSRREYAALTTRPSDLVPQFHSRSGPPDTG
jgi:type IV secretory system conjugative DNA transfer VirD4/TraG family protein